MLIKFSKFTGRTLACSLLALALASCDDAPVVAEKPAPEEATPGPPFAGSDRWLSHDDVRTPTYWLIERSSGRGFVGEDPRIDSINRALDAAQAQFHENRRMLANRAAQLTDVSAEFGETLLPEKVLADLTYPERGGGLAWFGVRAQAYIVLRRTGLDHAAAVAELIRQGSEVSP